MDQKTLSKYLKLLEIAKEDMEYRLLCQECAALDGAVLDLLQRLPEVDRDLLMDYIGVTGAVSRRLMEIAAEAG